MADWAKIKAEYIRGGIGQRGLAAKYGVSQNAIKKHSKAEKWVELRTQKELKKAALVVDACATKEADEALKVYEAADLATEKILGMLRAGGLTPQEMRNLTGALRDIAAVRGIKTEAEKREQEARIAKLRREADGENRESGGVEFRIAGMTAEEVIKVIG